MRRSTLTALVLATALALTGCVAAIEAPADQPISDESGVPESTATPQQSAAPHGAPQQGTAEWAALGQDEQVRLCEQRDTMTGCMLTWGDCFTTTFAAPDDPIAVAGEKPIVSVDRGAREHAMGEAVVDASGTPVAYVVAEGDIPDFVADRFCTHLAYLNGINSVRRASLAGNLYAGDTLNLNATTIFTVGDENGVVFAGTTPGAAPTAALTGTPVRASCPHRQRP